MVSRIFVARYCSKINLSVDVKAVSFQQKYDVYISRMIKRARS